MREEREGKGKKIKRRGGDTENQRRMGKMRENYTGIKRRERERQSR